MAVLGDTSESTVYVCSFKMLVRQMRRTASSGEVKESLRMAWRLVRKQIAKLLS